MFLSCHGIYFRNNSIEGARVEKPDLIRYLISKGADLNKKDKKGFYTPFLTFCGSFQERLQTLKILLEEGKADPNSADYWNRGALSSLVCSGTGGVQTQREAIQLMLNAGAKPDSDSNRAILHQHGLKNENFKLLLEKGARVNEVVDYGSKERSDPREWMHKDMRFSVLDRFVTPVNSLGSGFYPEKVKLLIEHGARHHRDATPAILKENGLEYTGEKLD